MSKQDRATDVAESFAAFIANFGHGKVDTLLSERLHELVTACCDTGRPGTLNIELKIKPEGLHVAVGFKINMKKPEPALAAELYFSTPEGGLAVEDPRQVKIPAKIIDTDWTSRS